MPTETKSAGTSNAYQDTGQVDTWATGDGTRVNTSDNLKATVAEMTYDFDAVLYGPTYFLYASQFGFTDVTGTINSVTATIEKSGTNSCFTGNTLIDTPKGKVPIKDIKRGDLVIGGNGKPTLVKKNAKNKVFGYRIVTTESCRVEATMYHPFKTKRGFVQLGKLRVGDSVMTSNGFEPITSMIAVKGEIDVYELAIEAPHTYFANGFLVHNKLITLEVYDSQVKLFDQTGVPFGVDMKNVTAWSAADANSTYIFTSPAISATNIKTTSFGVGIAAYGQSNTLGGDIIGCAVDWVQLVVDYTPVIGGTMQMMGV